MSQAAATRPRGVQLDLLAWLPAPAPPGGGPWQLCDGDPDDLGTIAWPEGFQPEREPRW